MNKLEENITNSFRLAKNDIMTLQQNLQIMSQNQERIMEWMTDLREKEMMLYNRMKKTPKTKTVSAKKKFVASVKGKKVHDSTCPFAKNIKPKSKIVFKTKNTALNKGYKACECLKR